MLSKMSYTKIDFYDDLLCWLCTRHNKWRNGKVVTMVRFFKSVITRIGIKSGCSDIFVIN